MKRYTPELGQACFGAPWDEYECPELLIAALEYLESEVARFEGNLGHRDYASPLANTGSAWGNDCFQMRSYSWADPEDDESCLLPNFHWRDLEVRWYKYARRGATVNREVTAAEIQLLLLECLESVTRQEEEWYRQRYGASDE